MDNIYDDHYSDYGFEEMGPWSTFFALTLAALVFILLWPIILVIVIYMIIQEKRCDAEMEEERRLERRKAARDEYFKALIAEETKKQPKRSIKKNVKTKSKKHK